VRLAHDARREARLALALTLTPALVGTALATLNLVPVAVVPLFALAGTLAAIVKARL
jgi:hypothetical protein